VIDWVEVCTILRDSGYAGAVSIELEDKNFDEDDSSKLGILQAANFLTSC
jgi:sugar phosphate isomerase/epimerase